ncbi:MAG: SIMPL domain-containing protein [Phycisphaerales bacterium]
MNHRFKFVAVAGALVISGLAFSAPFVPSQPAMTGAALPETTVSSDGTARVFRAPDFVDVVVGVVVQDKTAASAQAAANKTMEQVVAETTALTLAGAELQTGTVELEPRYSRFHNEQGEEQLRTIIGYQASMTLRVRTTNLKACAKIIDTALAAGANQVLGVSFQLREALEAREEALRLASRAAKRKAEVLADGLGVKLGRLVTASSSSGLATPWLGRGMYSNMAQVQGERGGGEGPSDAVVPGKIEVWATVSVQYAAGSEK